MSFIRNQLQPAVLAAEMPPILAEAQRNIHLKTVEGFGREWNAHSQEAVDPAEHRRLFEGYSSVFPFDAVPTDSGHFDLGWGTGRRAVLATIEVALVHFSTDS